MKQPKVVSFIGRPNVGKSSLFNRMIGRSTKAITHNKPGVTRDRHYSITQLDALAQSEPVDLIAVDTGGFYPELKEELEGGKEEKFFHLMVEHVQTALRESDLILLVLDGREGALPYDREITAHLRASGKDVWYLVNKCDEDIHESLVYDFYQLGLENEKVFAVSAAHGRGIPTFMEELHEFLLEKEGPAPSPLSPGVLPTNPVVGSVAIIGAPNAGKSSLLNLLVGGQRSLVSDVAGTTLDPIEGFFTLDFGQTVKEIDQPITKINNEKLIRAWERDMASLGGFAFDETEIEKTEGPEEAVAEAPLIKNTIRSVKIVDTAGIRKKGNVNATLEAESVYRALKSVAMADIVIVMMDATKGITHQDRRLCDIALEKGKSIVLVLNKADLLPFNVDHTSLRKEWLEDVRHDIPWLTYCQLIPFCALKATGVKKLKNILKQTFLTRRRPLPTGQVNQTVQHLVETNVIYPKGAHGKAFKVRYCAQVKSDPPTFILFCNKSKSIPDHYRRYLKNGLRRSFDIKNTPVHLLFRTGKDLENREGKKSRP